MVSTRDRTWLFPLSLLTTLAQPLGWLVFYPFQLVLIYLRNVIVLQTCN